MEEILEAAVLGDSDVEDEDIEDVLINDLFHDNLVGNRADIYGRFNFEEVSDMESKTYFRFEKIHIPFLAVELGIPNIITTAENITLPGRYLV